RTLVEQNDCVREHRECLEYKATPSLHGLPGVRPKIERREHNEWHSAGRRQCLCQCRLSRSWWAIENGRHNTLRITLAPGQSRQRAPDEIRAHLLEANAKRDGGSVRAVVGTKAVIRIDEIIQRQAT